MADDPILSVIIPVWNGADDLPGLLEALKMQTANRQVYEVIVVDNGSTDATAELLASYPQIRTFNEELPGSYRARNTGVEHAKGEYLLFTDADCIPHKNWVERALHQVAASQALGLVAGQVELFAEDSAREDPATTYERLIAFDIESYVADGHCVTANWLCRKSDLIAVGGFDPDLLSAGDTECSRRFVAAGHRITFDKKLIVSHPVRATLGELISKRRRIVGGHWSVSNLEKAGIARTLLGFSREGWRRARKIWSSPGQAKLRIGAIIVSTILTIAEIVELLRLKLGRPPHRS